jgi:hypothetical protein
VPAPEEGLSSYPDLDFKFNRLGIRVPLLAISPRIAKGVRVGEPLPAQKPTPTSQFEHTSVMATIRKLWGISKQNLTRRDGWAATFTELLSLDTPRETPQRTPNPPPPTQSAEEEGSLEVNDLQHHMLAVHRMLGQAQETPYPQTQGAVQLKQLYHSYKEEILSSWKSLQLFFAPSYGDAVAGPDDTTLLGNTWKLNEEKHAIETRFSVFGATLCLTNPGGEGVIYMAPCRYDASQMLTFHADFTVRNTAED